MNKYLLTGIIKNNKFPKFLSEELGEPRRNINIFTKELMFFFDVEYLSLVNSGSSANLIAALIVRETQKDKKTILISGFSFPTTVSSYSLLNFNIQLIDTEKDYFNISVEEIKRNIDNNTAAVVVTHFLGFPAKLQEIKEICDKYGAMLIQDACETMNLKYLNKSIHSFGDIITHSFYHPHHLSSYGGGAIIVNNKNIFKKAESFIHWGRMCQCHFNPDKCDAPHGINHNFYYNREGVNVEISELNACFGRFQLKDWDIQEQKRIMYYQILYDALKKYSYLKLFRNDFNVSPFVFPIKVLTPNFIEITQEILNNSIEIRNLMGGGIHSQPAFIHLDNSDLLNTKYMNNNTFFLGIHQYIENNSFNDMINLLVNIFDKYE